MKEKRNSYGVLVLKPEGKKFGKLRFRWENGIKMDFMWYERVWTGFICLKLDSVGKRKICWPSREFSCNFLVVHPVT
jgi:hypothetical protein